MNIAFVSQPWQHFPTPFEGREAMGMLTYELARRMAETSEVRIYGRRLRGERAEERTAENIEICRVPVPMRALRIGLTLADLVRADAPIFLSPLFAGGYAKAVARDLARRPVDLVHIMNFPQFAPPIRRANPNARIVLHMHSAWLGLVEARYLEPGLAAVDLIIGCSDYIAEMAHHHFPNLPRRPATIHNGVDPTRFAPQVPHRRGAGRHLCAAGRLSPEKGFHVLLQAFEEIAAEIPEARLDIVGGINVQPRLFHIAHSRDTVEQTLDAYYGGSLIDRFNRLFVHRHRPYFADQLERLPSPARRNVSLLGPMLQSQFAEHLCDADIFVQASIKNESFGLPVLEAMAAGVPVVATRSGGIPEILIDGETGVLVEPNDSDALARAVLRLMADDDLRQRLGAAGRQHAIRNFTWDRIAKQLQSHYNLLLDQSP